MLYCPYHQKQNTDDDYHVESKKKKMQKPILKVYFSYKIWERDIDPVSTWLYLLGQFLQDFTLNRISWNVILVPTFEWVQNMLWLLYCLPIECL